MRQQPYVLCACCLVKPALPGSGATHTPNTNKALFANQHARAGGGWQWRKAYSVTGDVELSLQQ
jgi:hypothetical protein